MSRKFPTYFEGFFAPAYSVFVAKCNKINDMFPNDVWVTVWKKVISFVALPNKSWNKKAYKISRKFPTYFVGVFCANLECILLYIISRKFSIYIEQILL